LMVVVRDDALAGCLAERFDEDLGEAERADHPAPSSLPGRFARGVFDRSARIMSSHL
jgi:hypothetical protein